MAGRRARKPFSSPIEDIGRPVRVPFEATVLSSSSDGYLIDLRDGSTPRAWSRSELCAQLQSPEVLTSGIREGASLTIFWSGRLAAVRPGQAKVQVEDGSSYWLPLEQVRRYFTSAPSEAVQLPDDQQCAICLGEFDRQVVARLECGHCFHADCLDIHAEKNSPNCPLCRQRFRARSVVRVRAAERSEHQSPDPPSPQTCNRNDHKPDFECHRGETSLGIDDNASSSRSSSEAEEPGSPAIELPPSPEIDLSQFLSDCSNSGYLGVQRLPGGGFKASLWLGQTVNLGVYTNLQEAATVVARRYIQARGSPPAAHLRKETMCVEEPVRAVRAAPKRADRSNTTSSSEAEELDLEQFRSDRSKSGYLGVIVQPDGLFRTQLNIHGKQRSFGVYNDVKEAATVVAWRYIEVHGRPPPKPNLAVIRDGAPDVDLSQFRSKKSNSGYLGVTRTEQGRFRAQLYLNGQVRNLGEYADLHEAARVVAKRYLSVHGSPPTPTRVSSSEKRKFETTLFNTQTGQEGDSALVGRSVRRKFHNEYYVGTISRFNPKTKWWHVMYLDGDEEDLNERQIMKALVPVQESEERSVPNTPPTANKHVGPALLQPSGDCGEEEEPALAAPTGPKRRSILGQLEGPPQKFKPIELDDPAKFDRLVAPLEVQADDAWHRATVYKHRASDVVVLMYEGGRCADGERVDQYEGLCGRYTVDADGRLHDADGHLIRSRESAQAASMREVHEYEKKAARRRNPALVIEDKSEPGIACALAAALGLTWGAVAKVMLPSLVSGGYWAQAPLGLLDYMAEVKCICVFECGGEHWEVVWMPRGGTSAGFSGGWRGFAIDQRLAPDDCVVRLSEGSIEWSAGLQKGERDASSREHFP